MGNISLSGQLKRLEEDYELIKRSVHYLLKKVAKPLDMRYQICFYAFGFVTLLSIKI